MTKKEFCKKLNELKQMQDKIEKVHLAMQELSPNFGGFCVEGYSDLVISLLSEVVGDKDDWIGYFVYELDFGKKATTGGVEDQNGKKWKLDTSEKLYELIKLK